MHQSISVSVKLEGNQVSSGVSQRCQLSPIINQSSGSPAAQKGGWSPSDAEWSNFRDFSGLKLRLIIFLLGAGAGRRVESGSPLPQLPLIACCTSPL